MSVALNVVIVLGIVIAGGFLLFFLGDFLMKFFDEKKAKSESTKVYIQPAVEEKKEPVMTQGIVQAYNPEAEEEKEETVEAQEQPAAEAEEEAEDEEEMRIAEARAALERRKQEILRRMQAQLEEDEEEEESEEEIEEDEAEEVEEDTAEEAAEETQETVEEAEGEEAEDEEEQEVGILNTEEELIEENIVIPAVDTDALQAEIEKLKNELGLQKEKNEMLEKELAEKSEVVEVETVTLGSKEDYEKELAEKQAKLKAVEKEFKQVKKDYIPLYRVHKNLEKDEKKLHRREAIVAKQKVVLYGVNNYADIDEEKAKKLAEDLDLLDGLKLSVNHCKEVVEQNKERYPILEKLYNTLKSQVEGLKLEIEDIENTIANFDNEEVSTEE